MVYFSIIIVVYFSIIIYTIWQRSVPDRLIRELEKRRYQEPGQLDLFKEKVEKHNEKYAEALEDEDDVDEIENEELFTES